MVMLLVWKHGFSSMGAMWRTSWCSVVHDKLVLLVQCGSIWPSNQLNWHAIYIGNSLFFFNVRLNSSLIFPVMWHIVNRLIKKIVIF